ncbi:MAG TPA: hypothetical protein V6D06_04360 [Trichocoleus sp.]
MSLFDVLTQAQQAGRYAADLAGRKDAAQFATTTNNGDPLSLRRIKTTTADKGARTEHDHAMRALPCPFWDPPLPIPGQALVLEAFDGNKHDQAYLGVIVNDGNPPHQKADPVNDDWRRIPGDSLLEIGRGAIWETGQNWQLRSQQALTFETAGGASITLGNDGSITITTAGPINIAASGPVTINGKAVCVLGGSDNVGHVFTNSGQ